MSRFVTVCYSPLFMKQTSPGDLCHQGKLIEVYISIMDYR